MGTNIRAEVSKNNNYWIDKHRYYELKHFCLQYPIFKSAYNAVGMYNNKSVHSIMSKKQVTNDSAIDNIVESRLYWRERMKLIEDAAMETDPVIGQYILKGVTEGFGYPYLKTRLNIPCCKDTYYQLYRKFFWILSKLRE